MILVFDESFWFGLLFTAIILSCVIWVTIYINRVIPRRYRISPSTLRKIWVRSAIIIGTLWIIQLIILGGVFDFYFQMMEYTLLIGLYAITFFLLYFCITRKILHENLQSAQKVGSSAIIHSVFTEKILLDIQELQIQFYTEEGVVHAVSGISFSINENEVFGLVGETGCGKSVTALAILRLISSPGEIIHGKMLFKGIDLLQLSLDEMRNYRGNHITMIFQDPLNSLNPIVKVGDQIIEVFMIHKQNELFRTLAQNLAEITKITNQIAELKTKSEQKSIASDSLNQLEERLQIIQSQNNINQISRDWARELIHDVGIPDPDQILNRCPFELSGGMRQRVMIAMALACSPQLLLADEPTTALDVTIQAQILQLLKDLKQKYHTSILLISHDLGVISEICDRVAIMYAGKIVEIATVHQLFKNPCHPYTHGLIEAIPRVGIRHDRLTIIPGMVPNLIDPPVGCPFYPRCHQRLEYCKQMNPTLCQIEDQHSVACYAYGYPSPDSKVGG